MHAYDNNIYVHITGWFVAILATSLFLSSAYFVIFGKNKDKDSSHH